MRSKGWPAFLMFLLGLGSATKIYFLGTISFTELVIFPLAPVLLLKQYSNMRREGLVSFVYMIMLLLCGMLFSAWWNKTPYTYTVKLFAVYYGFFSFFVVFYCVLRRNFMGLGWFFVGSAISGIITIWAFNPQAMASESGFAYIANADVERVISGPLFWIGKLRSFGQLPIMVSYFKTPLAYSIVTPVLFVAFALFSTISGRAQSFCVLLGGVMMFIGQKSRIKMSRIGKHFVVFAVLGGLVLLAYKMVYSYAAGGGYLGEEARNKYETQTDRGKGLFRLLMAGRKEFFIAASAIVDHPFVGFGPRAEDYNGYTEKFLRKYGSDQEIAAYVYYQLRYAPLGYKMQIPTHSHIMAAWLWCGLPGLIFWVWILYCLYRHIRYHSAAIPQWYGYFALSIPSMLWSIFFNPVGARFILPLLMVCMMFARAVSEGRILLPYEMEMEAREHD